MKKPTTQARPGELIVLARKGENEAQAIARTALTPSVDAGCTIARLSDKRLPGIEINALVEQLSALQAKAVSGDLDECQAMLVAQTHTLDALFNKLARKAFDAGDLNYGRTCLQLALKAQNAARSTVATLALIQQPRSATFVKQANVQVNHGVMPEPAPVLTAVESGASLSCEISSLENELCPATTAP